MTGSIGTKDIAPITLTVAINVPDSQQSSVHPFRAKQHAACATQSVQVARVRGMQERPKQVTRHAGFSFKLWFVMRRSFSFFLMKTRELVSSECTKRGEELGVEC
jgi:hypothetical protein